MNFENMENLKKNKPKEGELELERHPGPIRDEKIPQTPEKVHEHKMNATASTGLFEIKNSESTIKEELEKAAREAMPIVKSMAEKKSETIKNKDISFLSQSNSENIGKLTEKEINEGDMGHLMMLEEKFKKLKVAIANGEDFERDLKNTKEEYDKCFLEYSEKIKKESIDKK